MTPDDLIDDLQTMLRDGRLREMVDLTVRALPVVRSQMSPEHAVRLHELMHVADIFDDVGTRHDTPPAAEAEGHAARAS